MAGRAADDRQSTSIVSPPVNVAGDLVHRMTERGESFWSAVHAPFIGRDLAREQLRAVVKTGLERTSGNYRMVLELFNLPPTDYKRFLSFLRKHNCHFPVQAFRSRCDRLRSRTTSGIWRMPDTFVFVDTYHEERGQ